MINTCTKIRASPDLPDRVEKKQWSVARMRSDRGAATSGAAREGLLREQAHGAAAWRTNSSRLLTHDARAPA